MSYAAIAGKLKYGSPELVSDVSGDYLVYRYVGLASLLTTNRPAYNAAWGSISQYSVRAVRGPTDIEASTYAEMIVECATLSIAGSSQITNNEYPLYEIDFAAVERDLLAHPAFATLTAAERHQCPGRPHGGVARHLGWMFRRRMR